MTSFGEQRYRRAVFPKSREPLVPPDPAIVPSVPLFTEISMVADEIETDDFSLGMITTETGTRRVRMITSAWIRESDVVHQYTMEYPLPEHGHVAVMQERELTVWEREWLRSIGAR